ncbi:MAG TPA: hypothetical protein VJK90_14490 [Acetobacteraceae bacterium]|jgi:hypothetical protein|nr:hypothetical protein [Acetobacteraceae bacterium]
MIRPLTCISVLLACGSGLYLYQTKHHAQVVDRQIERTVQAITATRMQTRELAAAWTLLGNPDRLQLLANQYLDIKPVQPSQFVALSDLDNRLPAPRALPPSAEPEDSGSETTPVASADGTDASAPAAPAAILHAVTAAGVPPGSTASQAPSPVGSAQFGRAPGAGSGTSPSPVLATGVAKAPAAMAGRSTDRQPAEAPRPPREVAQARPTPLHPAGSPPVIAELDRPASSPPQRLAPAPQTGSLLGMAHIAVPAPVPLPVSAASFSSNHN